MHPWNYLMYCAADLLDGSNGFAKKKLLPVRKVIIIVSTSSLKRSQQSSWLNLWNKKVPQSWLLEISWCHCERNGHWPCPAEELLEEGAEGWPCPALWWSPCGDEDQYVLVIQVQHEDAGRWRCFYTFKMIYVDLYMCQAYICIVVQITYREIFSGARKAMKFSVCFIVTKGWRLKPEELML